MRKNRRLREIVDEIDPAAAEAALIVQAEAQAPDVQPGAVLSEEPPLQGSGNEQDNATEEATFSGLRFRVVQRKTKRQETTPDVSARIDRIRRRQS